MLYELAHRDRVSAADLARELSLDPGYLSRLLAAFTKRKLIVREASPGDGRLALVSLTRRGRDASSRSMRNPAEAIGEILAPLSAADRARLVAGLATVRAALGDGAGHNAAAPSFMLRGHQPGDIGWVIHRQGKLYAEEYGWDETYEALVAEILAAFIKTFDAKRERAWIAEIDGAIGRLGVSGAAIRRGGKAPPALCRALGARHMGWARGWSRSASPSPAARATARYRCGRTTCWLRPGASTKATASG